MSNSNMVSYTKLSPNHSGRRTHSIDRITPHCVVGQCSVETLGNIFAPTSREASCNYGIGVDGRIGMYVEEKNRSWCSSSNANDQRAVTIECASDTYHPYAMNSKVYDTLIKLCVDICRRNGKKKLLWFGDKNKSLNYSPKSDEMVLTVHKWFANKSCPGDWLYSRLGDLAKRVTAELGGPVSSSTSGLYRVRKSWTDSKSQVGAFSVFENAEKCADSHKGYSVYDEQGVLIYPKTNNKSIDELAREVINGLWGNGSDRKNKLISASYDYDAVQNRVNEILDGGKATPSKSIDTLAKEVIRGDWGNGADRKKRLTAAGYNYDAVQKRVNQILG
ncbi:hypothetical protein A9CBEGH2_05010 [Amedibacterium intestinale]|uniref:N-acetylmuramoyl-L-alanine amidase n=1 Tax=Amedibacterium intestinale TaxID=2583452 RepID=UPI001373C4F5|nr:N-acetylmuramoyl-L-alanine amidase [Amedibacterium intestinale]BBK61561.1 hypothetical protein A9CBEGH2_05010 [Amedibacterium intestinale]